MYFSLRETNWSTLKLNSYLSTIYPQAQQLLQIKSMMSKNLLFAFCLHKLSPTTVQNDVKLYGTEVGNADIQVWHLSTWSSTRMSKVD